jgi:hypothetical protein
MLLVDVEGERDSAGGILIRRGRSGRELDREDSAFEGEDHWGDKELVKLATPGLRSTPSRNPEEI